MAISWKRNELLPMHIDEVLRQLITSVNSADTSVASVASGALASHVALANPHSTALSDLGYTAGLVVYSFTNPALHVATAVHAAITLPDSEPLEVTTDITNPDMPRNLEIVGNQVGISGNVVIVGTDADDDPLTETIVASGTDTVVGTKAFKTVTSITVPVKNGSGDTISIGTGSKLGVGAILTTSYLLAGYCDGTKEGTEPTLTKNASMPLNLVAFNTAFDGAKDFLLYVIANEA